MQGCSTLFVGMLMLGTCDAILVSRTCQEIPIDILETMLENTKYHGLSGTTESSSASRDHMPRFLQDSPPASRGHSLAHFRMAEKRQGKEERATATVPSLLECGGQTVWKDLGHEHYPRLVRAVLCQRTCNSGLYKKCQPVMYPVQVLKRKSVLCKYEDASLPASFESQWELETIEVPVCCSCTTVVPSRPQR